MYTHKKIIEPDPKIDFFKWSHTLVGTQAAGMGTQAASKNGSYHCDYHKVQGKCDTCSHMTESKSVFSSHFEMNHAIAGNNTHLKATEKPKLRWFIYLEQCLHPEGTYQYVGSTNSVTDRWANTKSKCWAGNSEGTGLEKHLRMDV